MSVCVHLCIRMCVLHPDTEMHSLPKELSSTFQAAKAYGQQKTPAICWTFAYARSPKATVASAGGCEHSRLVSRCQTLVASPLSLTVRTLAARSYCKR